MKVLAIVPARSGSKGVPDKNMKRVGGKTLIFRACQVGVESRCDQVVVSTDSKRYKDEGLVAGAKVPGLRPPALADDETPMMDVIQHMVEKMENKEGRYDAIVLLQPTSPFRTAEDINAALDILAEGADSVVSVIPVAGHNNAFQQLIEVEGHLTFVANDDYKYTRRQDMPECYIRNGAIYAFKRDLLEGDNPSFFGTDCRKYLMDPAKTVNIDTPEDLARAKILWGELFF